MRQEARKDLDLLVAYQQMGAGKQRRTGIRNGFAIILVGVAFLVAGLFYAKNVFDEARLDKRIAQLEEQMALPVYNDADGEMAMIDGQLRDTAKYNRILSTHREALSTAYRPSSELFARIEAVGQLYGVTFTSLNYEKEEVTVTCATVDAAAAAAYAKALEDGVLDNVIFTGYALTNYSAGSAAYGFTVTGVREGA